jgi:hypothetical protein
MLGEGEPAAGPWRVESIEGFARLLLAAAGRHAARPVVLAVDGHSGSGKTTISQRISDAVPSSVVVRTDDVAWQHSMFGWTDLLVDGILKPVHRGEPVSFRPPAWRRQSRDGAIEVPAGLDLVIVEGVGVARRELMVLMDLVVWVQSDMIEAERRGIERDGGDDAAASFWRLWMAEELPFIARERPWERAAFVVDGTPLLPHDTASQVVIAGPIRRHGLL